MSPVPSQKLPPQSFFEATQRGYFAQDTGEGAKAQPRASQDATEAFKIYFLLGEPKRDDAREAFVNAKHLLDKMPGEKQLVQEDQLERFAEGVAEEIAPTSISTGHAERGG